MAPGLAGTTATERAPAGVGNHRALARIDLGALSHNVGEIRRLIGSDVQLCAVVKADGYGHGAAAIARHLVRCGTDALAVASLEEATALRDAGVSTPILVFGHLGAAEVGEAVRLGLTPAVSSLEAGIELAEALGDARLRVHLKFDTGMRRMGLDPAELPRLLRSFEGRAIEIQGVFSHLAHGDSPGHESVANQQTELLEVISALEAAGHVPRLRHIANSAGLISDTDTHLDMVRCGIALYGGLPHPSFAPQADLRPVMEVLTRVVQVRSIRAGDGIGYGHTWRAPRDSRIAVLPIGYGQGYLRSLSNRGYTQVRGRLAPIVGTISMDQTMIDVTAAGGVQPGDEGVLWGGRNEGAPDVMELAERAGTIGYELLTRVGNSIPRTYIEPFG